MARGGRFDVSFDIAGLEALGDRLGEIDAERIGELAVGAVNETVDFAYDLARRTILNGINLTDAYVARRMEVKHATAKNPIAKITAFGGKEFTTNLSAYGALQNVKDVNWSNSTIQAAGYKFGDWPGWTRRTGNAALGVAVDSKASGKSVEVVRGRRKDMGPVFSIPGKTDKDGNLILFRRNKAEKVESLKGPSVYQLFRVAIPHLYDPVEGELERSVVDVAERELTKALT